MTHATVPDDIPQWTIRDAQNRLVFSGPEDDARDYLQANYPRIHAEPNTNYGPEGPAPSAVLLDPDGNTHIWDSKTWKDNIPGAEPPVPSHPDPDVIAPGPDSETE